MNIVCDNCGKDSGVEKTESVGRNAALVEDAGFIPKCLIMYGINEWILVCSQECLSALTQKKFDETGVSEEKKNEVAKFLAEAKAKIPEQTKEICTALGKLQAFLNSARKS
jgi:hypothetical protein